MNERREKIKQKKLNILKSISNELESIPIIKEEGKKIALPKDLYVFPILEFVSEIKKDPSLKQSLEKFESQHHKEIINSHKFRLLNHIGNFSNSLNNIFDIDATTFNRYQEEINRLNNWLGLAEKDIDSKIILIIALNVYVKNPVKFFNI